jgi:predicted  nucleic acid-binding Zn-ribbon protein
VPASSARELQALIDINKELSEEINRLKSDKQDAVRDIGALRDYAAELQTHLEGLKKSHSMYELRLSNELMRLREMEAGNRLAEAMGLNQVGHIFV